VEKEVICAPYRSMLDIKLNSQMLGKKDILCIAIKKNWEDVCLNVYCHRVTTQLQLTNISILNYFEVRNDDDDDMWSE
jgi:hypothetical protein